MEVCPLTRKCLWVVLCVQWRKDTFYVVGCVVMGKSQDEMFTKDYCTWSDIRVHVIIMYNAGEKWV